MFPFFINAPVIGPAGSDLQAATWDVTT